MEIIFLGLYIPNFDLVVTGHLFTILEANEKDTLRIKETSLPRTWQKSKKLDSKIVSSLDTNFVSIDEEETNRLRLW